MKIDIYQPQNLPPESFNAIKQLYIDTMATLEGAALEVDYLKSAIENTQMSLSSKINAKLEKADITCKYTREPPKQAFIIPTIDNSTSYDISQVTDDNNKFEAIGQKDIETTRQADLYYNMTISNFKDIWSKLQKLQRNISTMDSYMAQLETYSYGNIKPANN
jgi:hypothetical protein